MVTLPFILRLVCTKDPKRTGEVKPTSPVLPSKANEARHRSVPNAPDWIRTSTPKKAQALNLPRMPIPPPGLAKYYTLSTPLVNLPTQVRNLAERYGRPIIAQSLVDQGDESGQADLRRTEGQCTIR